MQADSFFANLSRRQSMFLLTAVTFGGAEGAACFDCLPDDEGEILRERARRLASVPREERIPFLVQEIKRLVMGRKGGDLRGADPEQVVQALRGERPAMAEVLLRALPAELSEPVRNELPPSAIQLSREVRPEILEVLRWHFERRLRKLSPRTASFLFADLLSLSGKDLLALGDHLGAEELAPAVAGLPRRSETPFSPASPPSNGACAHGPRARRQATGSRWTPPVPASSPRRRESRSRQCGGRVSGR